MQLSKHTKRTNKVIVPEQKLMIRSNGVAKITVELISKPEVPEFYLVDFTKAEVLAMLAAMEKLEGNLRKSIL